MIIICPNCSARYRVKDELIKAKGKRVKCKKCQAVFVAYPDRDAVLEKAPPQAAEARHDAATQAVAPTPAAPQATVKVDRSQLDKFIQQKQAAPPAPESTQSTLQVDPAQFRKYMDSQKAPTEPDDAVSAGATVQVDRSQIDAFLQESAGSPPETPATAAPPAPSMPAPSSQDTIQVDPDALSSLVHGDFPPTADPTIAQAPPVPNFNDPTQAPNLVEPIVTSPSPFAQNTATTAASGEPAIPDEPDFGELDAPFIAPSEPSFPSDADLGISNAPTMDPNAITQDIPVMPIPPAVEVQSTVPPVAEQLYQAEVEGKIYNNLRVDAIGRWIREGRLLEGDQIARYDSDDFQQEDQDPELDYQRADQCPEFAAFFQQAAAEQPPKPEPKKKGFFARLFSFGK